MGSSQPPIRPTSTGSAGAARHDLDRDPALALRRRGDVRRRVRRVPAALPARGAARALRRRRRRGGALRRAAGGDRPGARLAPLEPARRGRVPDVLPGGAAPPPPRPRRGASRPRPLGDVVAPPAARRRRALPPLVRRRPRDRAYLLA